MRHTDSGLLLPEYKLPRDLRMAQLAALGSAAGQLTALGASAIAPALPWYLTNGIALSDVRAAYQAKGAASYALSKANLANPGTNDIPGAPIGAVAPTWGIANGWGFDGATQGLATLINPTAQWTFIVRFSGLGAGELRVLTGTTNLVAPVGQFFITPRGMFGSGVQYEAQTGALVALPNLTSGVLGIAGRTGYRGGLSDGTIPVGDGGLSVFPFYIGCHNNGGTPISFINCFIQAVVYYSTTLTDTQMLDVSTKMAVL